MKKLTALLLSALLMLTLAACNAPDAKPDDTTPPAADQPTTPETPVEPEAPADPVTPVEPEIPADPDAPVEPEAPVIDDETQALIDLFVGINDGVEVMGLSTDPISDEMWSGYLFIDPIEGAKAVVSQSMVGSIPHCACLVKVPEGADAQTVADDIAANANPRKWVCVEAESVQTAVRGDLVFFVMSDTATADNMVANFNAAEIAE